MTAVAAQGPPGPLTKWLASPAGSFTGVVAGSTVVGAAATIRPVVALAALFAVALGLLTIARRDIGAYVLVAAAAPLAGLRRGLPIPGFRLSEVLIVGVSTIIVLNAPRSARSRWRVFDYAALAYCVSTLLLGGFDVIGQGHGSLRGNFGTLLGPFQFLLLYRAVLTALPDTGQRRKALGLLLLASVPVSALAILQQLGVGNIRHVLETATASNVYEKHPNVPRATGPFPHWHELGGYLMIIILVGLGLLLEGSRGVLRRSVVAGVITFAAIGLVQTASITPILGVVVGALALGAWAGKLRQILLGLGLTAGVLLLLFAPLLHGRYRQEFDLNPGEQRSAFVPQTISYRYYIWTNEFVPVLANRLLTGYGPEPPPTLAFGYTESLYVTLILRGGLPLLLVYGGLMWALFKRARLSAQVESAEQRALARVLVVLVVMLVGMHLFISYFVDSGPPHLIWILCGLAFAAAPVPPSRSTGRSYLASR